MKKSLFLFISFILLLSSCSSENDPINNNQDENLLPKQKVSFSIKSNDFEVDKSPLRANPLGQTATLLQIRVYKESGEIYQHLIFTPWNLNGKLQEDGSFPYSLELPKGNYHLAIIQNDYNTSEEERVIGITKTYTKNFYTDEVGAGPIGNHVSFNQGNYRLYYQSIKLSVSDQAQEIGAIVLEPMWSYISVIITDPKTFRAPTNTNLFDFGISPANYNINLSTKLAVDSSSISYANSINSGNPGLLTFDEIRKKDTLSFTTTVSKSAQDNNNLKLSLLFTSSNQRDPFFMRKEIDLKTQIENGRHYVVRGALGNIAEVGDGSMDVTFAPFEEEPTKIPFQ